MLPICQRSPWAENHIFSLYFAKKKKKKKKEKKEKKKV